ncbi:MAG: hypothetical protein ACRYFS_05400 [Janthinobacterium lividum]
MVSSKKLGFSLAALTVLGFAASQPATAQTLLTPDGTVVYGSASSDTFPAEYGSDGSIEFDTTPSGQTAGNFVFKADTFTPATGDNPGATTIISQPSYISSFSGFSVSHAAGYGHPDISTGKESGLVGYTPGGGGGNLFSFTAGSAASFTFGVLSNYSDDPTENSSLITLTSSGSTPVSVSESGSSSAYATAYLFDITNATAGETFTVSTDQGYISGATFSPAAVPEVSSVVSFGLLLALGLGGFTLARRKHTASAV